MEKIEWRGIRVSRTYTIPSISEAIQRRNHVCTLVGHDRVAQQRRDEEERSRERNPHPEGSVVACRVPCGASRALHRP